MDAEKYKKAGRIHAEVTQEIQERLKTGMKLLEIAEFIEKRILEKGGELAFPVNTSLNDIAAHYVAQHGDTRTVERGDLLKIDIGVHVDGHVADGAFTYCSEKNDLAVIAQKAIDEAVKVIRPGVKVGEVSLAIDETVKKAGLGLIVNLTGHGVDEYQFHAPPTVPNTATNSPVILEEGMVIAIEPFVTESPSQVRESAPVEIYRFLQEKPIRMTEARAILRLIQEHYHSFPFAKRWLYEHFSPFKVSMALRMLETAEAIESYPPLKDVKGQKIAQAEHTVIVGDPPVVITKL